MANRSIYARPNEAVTGGSEQAHYEYLWGEGQRQRLIVRGVIAGIVLIAGSFLFNPIVGIILGLLAAGADLLYNWRKHASTTAWRSGDGGRRQTDRLLRTFLEWRGFTVLRNRHMPGGEGDGIQHLVIGPSGLFLIQSRAWSPDTQIGSYGGKLFFGKRAGEKWAGPIAEAARSVSAALSEAMGEDVPVTAVMALHGGRISGRTAIHCQGVTLLRASRVPGWIRGYEARRTDGTDGTAGKPYSSEQVESLARTAARVLRPLPLLPRS